MSEFTVTIDGNEVSVPADQVQIPEGYVAPDQLKENYVKKDYFQEEINRRKASATEDAKKRLADDDEFFQTIAKKRGIPLDESGKPKLKGDDVDIDKVKNSIIEEQVNPLRQELESTRKDILKGRILNAAVKAGVDERLLKGVNGSDPLVVNATIDQFGFDPETRSFGLKDGDGFKYANEPSSSKPYAGPEDLFNTIKKDPEYADWFKDDRQRGSGIGNGAKGGSGQIVLTAEEAKDRAKYKEAKAQADKNGQKLVIK